MRKLYKVTQMIYTALLIVLLGFYAVMSYLLAFRVINDTLAVDLYVFVGGGLTAAFTLLAIVSNWARDKAGRRAE